MPATRASLLAGSASLLAFAAAQAPGAARGDVVVTAPREEIRARAAQYAAPNIVNIRGLDANLNGATYGGVVLLNTNPGGTAAGGGGRAVSSTPSRSAPWA